MKQLITATASLILILALIAELINVNIFYCSLLRADYEMYSLNDLIRYDGGVTQKSEKMISEILNTTLGCDEEDVVVNYQKKPVKKGGYIEYEVSAMIFNQGSWLLGHSKEYCYKFNRKYSIVSTATED